MWLFILLFHIASPSSSNPLLIIFLVSLFPTNFYSLPSILSIFIENFRALMRLVDLFLWNFKFYFSSVLKIIKLE
jgi:hypothetical protein